MLLREQARKPSPVFGVNTKVRQTPQNTICKNIISPPIELTCFFKKNISYLYHNDIINTYEKGTYPLNGKQLTQSPQSSSIESWSKA